MGRLLLTFLVVLTAFSQALAGIVVMKVRSIGVGVNEQAAINEALENAVKQVYGVTMVVQKECKNKNTEANGNFSYKVSVKSKVNEAFKGVLNGYRVLKLYRGKDGLYRAVIVAKVVKYELPGFHSSKQRRVAVYPFTGPEGKELSQLVTTYLTQSRRFAVLDREHFKYYEKEKQLVLSKDAAKFEKAKLGHLEGADYIVIGEVKELSVEPVKGSDFLKIPTPQSYRVRYWVSYQVLLFANNQVKYSNLMLTGT
jgi:curli biogenesis system outer membrane secretion channel CsgG